MWVIIQVMVRPDSAVLDSGLLEHLDKLLLSIIRKKCLMKQFQSIIAAIAILFLSSSHAVAMGFLPPEDLTETSPLEVAVPDDIVTEVDFNKCLPHQATPDEICYISGGIGGDEVSQFKSRAKQYLLEIVFVQKAVAEDNNRIEEYLAEVQLKIKDSKGNVVVDVTTEGPFFLADLPLGKYQIIADHDGVIKTNVVKIAAKKHQRTVFLWSR
jgi:hypothetical protein